LPWGANIDRPAPAGTQGAVSAQGYTPPAGSEFVQVACATNMLLALRQDGTVAATGSGGMSTGIPALTGVKAIALGADHAVGCSLA
jgi:alpha-tubulin suppressor-like RCC1 family protein